MPLKKFLLTACLVALPSFASSATLSELKVDGGWSEFRFMVGLEDGEWLDTSDLQPGQMPGVLRFKFTLAKRAVLQVTDGWLLGDRFQVYSDGILLGETSTPSATAGLTDQQIEALGDIRDDWSSAFDNERWSSGSWLLDVGEHTITGFVTEMPTEPGRGAVRLISPVPLPASSILMLSAFGAWFGFSRRRNRKAGAVV